MKGNSNNTHNIHNTNNTHNLNNTQMLIISTEEKQESSTPDLYICYKSIK